MRLMEERESAERAALAAGSEDSAQEEDKGLRQHDLMMWYLERETQRWGGFVCVCVSA